MSEKGRVLADRYELKELIGQGGMADVYLAYDDILKREVAVKILRSSLTGDPIYITRFHREARAAAALCHRNIVEIYDVGEEDDLYYIVMEYVRGQTLKELINKRGALHYVEAVDIMKQVASATALAHSMGIVHRDLKPQNILVTDSGIVKIADFGIASIQSLSQVTQTDTIMGSLHYLAPEIARGEKATPQSDIYALGVLFYELLRGDVPFNGESPVNIALKHMRDEIPSVRAYNPAIPQSVENIIIKATAKNTNNRYQCADDMLDDLDTCLERLAEEKLTFDQVNTDPTIIASDSQFFTKTAPIDPETTQTEIEEIKPQDEKKKEPMDKKKKIAIGAAIGAVIVCLAIVAGFFLLGGNKDGMMMDLVGKTEKEATALLIDKGYKVSDNVNYELSDKYEKGLVVATDPEAGHAINKGDTVTLTLSKGKYIIMEDYTGVSYDTAYKKLTKLGYKVKKYEKSDDEYKAGIVIGQSISEGEKQDPNEKGKIITLTVSKGVTITVPSLYGQDINAAKSTLESQGFTNVKLSVLPSPTDSATINSMSVNTVVKQSVAPYTQVTSKGTEIILYYYDKKPTPPTPPSQPDLPEDDNGDDASQNAQSE
ncbi:MAG: Stk1 family PASTA domain-containing Ser/Thr kinase [Catenibacterium mitsuokai]|uniref:Stk1 family PASTA domain-containing Ser/Thr kinase n=1 Tax=Catenibacterium mitsuokai TaxID=100886 RepID=UPI0006BF4470|nr:Stk1 family PASTA domain-containing Ser/Thr kinase [Catenibacterium mitsuokai]MDD6596047.1 Stk1 family PASTA domain-containing Ser/Thr kinase [Catenibacterium mitsuokai]MDY3676123.1 Stk1 family PASTA domain-containing Ser/Thr kinase [Catenibacterium mitsuokai]CUO81948.1 Serine/threonine-protein kinase PrkC [Catenibacterium mitsuokai]